MPIFSYKWSVNEKRKEIYISIYKDELLMPIKEYVIPFSSRINTRRRIEDECIRLGEIARREYVSTDTAPSAEEVALISLKNLAPSRPIPIE
jgi:hypothetical protein